MTVVKFPRRARPLPQGWQPEELRQVVGACAGAVSVGEASGWDVGATERGDPQLYLIGPPPDHECILCISRIGRRYVIEDGKGGLVFEHDNPMLLAEQAIAALRRRKVAIVARIAIVWCAMRETLQEKTEAFAAESPELLSNICPQIVALA
jgi:hypothetical protein